MTARYRLTRRAAADLTEIREYLLAESGQASSIVRTAFTEAFELLAQNPHAGHERRDLAPAGYRFWNVFSWLVVYRAEPGPIVIVRVLHAARNVRRLLREPNDD